MTGLKSIFFALLFLFLCLVAGSIFFALTNATIDFSALSHYHAGKPSIVLDDQGTEWARFQLDRRDPITLNQMPQHLINAFLAAEDWQFFKHAGISWKGIARSIFVNLYHGRKVQGASTITQQLVKLLFFDLQKTYSRKIKEQCCALLVEQKFSKEQILEAYLNHVCFGCGIYGVQAASQRFWGKDTLDLTIAECATLAGIVCSPSRLCPLLYPLSAQSRRDVVLHQMKKLNFITESEYDEAQNTQVTIVESQQNNYAPHLRETIRIFLEKKLGKKDLYTGGLIIQTTVNKKLQEYAQNSFVTQIKKLKEDINPLIDGGLISIDVKTGDIKALVGGYNFSESKFNRALQARRQIGSTFKPLIYATALKQGLHFACTQIDEPIQVMLEGDRSWEPKNYNNLFAGQMTLAYALSHSNNIVAIKTFLQVGAKPVIELAKKAGIKGPFQPYPALALGCVDATLQEVVGMFNIFANNGIHVEPHAILWVKNRWGTKIYKKEVKEKRVLDSCICGQVVKVLGISANRVHQWYPKNWIDAQVISKTGTTNDSRTCWFAGATPTLTTAVYVGCDDNRSMGKNIYPIRTAFPIWLNTNNKVTFDQKEFLFDPSLREVFVHEKTGMFAWNKNDKNIISILVSPFNSTLGST